MVAKVVPLLVIVGETASGKSALSMSLARKFNGEIICADSRTIYKDMDIGTAKPNAEDRAEIKHYLLDIIEPGQRYSASQFKEDALKAISEITKRGKLSILVGGTGLYIDAVIFDYQFNRGNIPKNPDNPRHLAAGSYKRDQKLRPNTLVLGLQCNREVLNNRIERRIEQMLESGFVDETKALISKYGVDNEVMFSIGYKTMAKYLDGEISLNTAKTELAKGDRSLAKRQRTWFKRNKSIHWVTTEQVNELVEKFLLKNSGM